MKHFLAAALAGVFHNCRNGHAGGIRFHHLRLPKEVRIAESVSERVLHFLLKGIEVPIADVDVLFIEQSHAIGLFARNFVIFQKVGEIDGGRIIIIVQRPGVGQMPARVFSAVQQLDKGITRTHARKTGIDSGFDIVFFHPFQVDGIAGIDDGNRLFKYGADCRDHSFLDISQIVTAFDGLVVQEFTGGAGDKQQSGIAPFLRFFQFRFCRRSILKSTVDGTECFVDGKAAVFSHRFMKVRLPAGIDQPCAGCGIAENELRRAKAVQHSIFPKRQHISFIFQKHHALRGSAQGHRVVGGIALVLLPARQRFETEGLIFELTAVFRCEAGQRYGIFPIIFPRDLSHRDQHHVHFDDGVHEKSLAAGDLDPIHGHGSVAVFCERLGKTNRQRIGALDKRAVFAFDLFEIQCSLQRHKAWHDRFPFCVQSAEGFKNVSCKV